MMLSLPLSFIEWACKQAVYPPFLLLIHSAIIPHPSPLILLTPLPLLHSVSQVRQMGISVFLRLTQSLGVRRAAEYAPWSIALGWLQRMQVRQGLLQPSRNIMNAFDYAKSFTVQWNSFEGGPVYGGIATARLLYKVMIAVRRWRWLWGLMTTTDDDDDGAG